MRNIFILFVVTLTIKVAAQTNPPTIQWERSLGGSNDDRFYAVQQTYDHGYIIAGSTKSNDGDVSGNHDTSGNTYDVWIIKLDTTGNIQWNKVLGGTNDEEAYSIQQTKDYGYIFTGYTQSNNGDVHGNHDTTGYTSDVWVVKLDTAGNIQWQKCLGGSMDDAAYSVQQTNDRGYIIAGYTFSNDGDVSGNHGPGLPDYWIVKLDTVGNIQWQKCLGGNESDEAYSIHQTVDGGFFVTGGTVSDNGDVSGLHSYDTTDYWVVKLDTGGNIQWQKCLGGTNYDDNFGGNLAIDGYIVIGASGSNDGDVHGNHNTTGTGWMDDYWVVKLDTGGNIQWQKCLGGSNEDEGNYALQLSNRNYLVAGITYSNDGDVSGIHDTTRYTGDFWIVELDTAGNIIFQKCFGGTNDEFISNESSTPVQQTNDGGFIIGCSSMSNDGDVSGHHGSSTTYDIWIAKLGYTTGINEPKIISDISIFPNPSKGQFNVQIPQNTKYIEIFDECGQIVEKRDVKQQNIERFNINECGIYLVKIETEKETITRKVVICK